MNAQNINAMPTTSAIPRKTRHQYFLLTPPYSIVKKQEINISADIEKFSLKTRKQTTTMGNSTRRNVSNVSILSSLNANKRAT